jgi:hypothetical protein
MSTIKSLRCIAFIFSLLSLHILTACSATEVKVKDYSSTSCPSNDSNMKPDKNVASMASGYYVLYASYYKPEIAEFSLNGKYATGKTEVVSKSFNYNIQTRLNPKEYSLFPVKMVSLVEMPFRTETNQNLQFGAACQLSNAITEDRSLGQAPIGSFYLVANKDNFVTLEDGSNPNPNTRVKFTLLNPTTQETEEATFSLAEITGQSVKNSATPPLESAKEQVKNLIFGKSNSGSSWEIQSGKITNLSEPNNFFSITTEKGGELIKAQILDIEFLPPEEK